MDFSLCEVEKLVLSLQVPHRKLLEYHVNREKITVVSETVCGKFEGMCMWLYCRS